MAKKPTAIASAALSTPESIAERFKDFPAIDVISRRLINPDDPGSLPILLKGESVDACHNSDHQRRLKPGATKCHVRDADTGRPCGKPVRLWHIHTCNTAIEGRWAQMKSKGYVPVLVDELLDQEDVSDLVRRKEDDGKMYVRRGDQGKEITMKQPLEIYNHIKRLQAEQRTSRANSARARKEDLAEAVGAGIGDEAGSMVQRGAIRYEEHTSTKTTLAEEAGE